VANRDLSESLTDVSEWRSGGDVTRPVEDATTADRGLEGSEGAERGPGEGAGAPVTVSGDVLAATTGGPDVRPPDVVALGDTRTLGPAEASDSWADDASDWRSGGEPARADTGEGVSEVATVPAMPEGTSMDAPADRGLEAEGAVPEGAIPPHMLSRSALAAAAPPDAVGADRGLAPEETDPNLEGYGDGGPE
jgi:hypothetical protein